MSTPQWKRNVAFTTTAINKDLLANTTVLAALAEAKGITTAEMTILIDANELRGLFFAVYAGKANTIKINDETAMPTLSNIYTTVDNSSKYINSIILGLADTGTFVFHIE
jgi:uncharacterized protein YutE (UPF0331/DUF86 family)